MAESTGKPEYVVGVDLGGTKIYAGVFDDALKCVGTAKRSTKAQRGPEGVIARIVRCIQDAVDECDLSLKQVKGVGIGAPGAVDPESGTVIFAPNLNWKGVSLEQALGRELGVPVRIENDANVSTLGIHEVELKRKPRDVIGIYIGTGIGGGLILNGDLYSGYNRTAGEIGHMVVEVGGPKCGCGNHGCFEAVASRNAMVKKIQAAVKEGRKTLLTELVGPELAVLRSGDLRKAIRRGDKLVERIVEEAAEYTGIAVANVLNLLNPEYVVLGGGVIEALGDEMMGIIIETARDYAMPGTIKGCEIMATKLGDEAGIIGGAVLARWAGR